MMTQERTGKKQCEEDQTLSAQDQHVPALPPGSIYSDEEALVLGPWQKMRQRCTRQGAAERINGAAYATLPYGVD